MWVDCNFVEALNDLKLNYLQFIPTLVNTVKKSSFDNVWN